MTTLRCDRLTLRLGRKTVLEDFSATFAPGELAVLAGPNGSGKTTLLRALARALVPTGGRVLCDGADADAIPRAAYARRVAYLPQSPDARSLAGLPVRAAVAAGRLPHTGFFGALSRRDRAAVGRAIEATGLAALAGADAGSLSGGETRRMFLAAALAQEADALLLDEPFEGLDAASRAALAEVIRGQLAAGRSVVVATHDLAPLGSIPRRVIEMKGPPEAQRKGRAAAGRTKWHRSSFFIPSFVIPSFVVPSFVVLAVAALGAATARGCPPGLLWSYRVPRLACAFSVGGILAVAGCVYQTLFRNPLASPYTLGTASGATFGACLATALAPGAVPVGGAAFAGALLSLALVRACGGSGGRPGQLLLGGIAGAYLFGAGTMLCQFAMTPWESFAMAHWSLGGIVVPEGPWRAALPAAWCAALALSLLARPLDALLAGDDAAVSHGLDPARLRLGLLGASSLLVACAVAVCGPVGFVGLLVPHLARLCAGASHRRLVPVCAVGGGLFLALCDAVARALPFAGTPPVGVVTAALGAPALVALLARASSAAARGRVRGAGIVLAAVCLGAAAAGCAPRRGEAPSAAGDSPRIVSFLPSGTETLFALGLGPCVVGRSRFCDFPAEAAALPAVGDLFSADEDALAALRPTHAVLGREDAPQAPLLRALGCRVVGGGAQTAADVLAFADALGDLFPDRTNGLALAGSPWRTAMEALADPPAPAPGARSALVVVSHAPGRWGAAFAAGEGTFHDELLRAAGMSNALAGVCGYPSLDPDRLAALAPDVLVDVHPDGGETSGEAWGYLPGTTRVAVLRDTAALRPGPRLPGVLARFRALAY